VSSENNFPHFAAQLPITNKYS